MARVQRICIFGTSGSGKTTLGRELARRTGAVSIDLDDLHWTPNWVGVSDEEFRNRVEEATQTPRWVISGNYSRVQSIYMPKADMMIWLDYSFPVTFGRVFKRTLRRVILKEACCNGNYENWRIMFSRESILLWVFKTYRKNQRKYGPMFAQPERDGVRYIRFRSPKEAREWLERVGE